MTLAGTAFLAAGAWADLDITFPATVMTDTALIKEATGVSQYQSTGSKVVVSLPGDGSLKFNWNIAPAATDGPYAATGGVLVPITSSWDLKNLNAADSIYFDVKADAKTNINFIIGSRSYPAAMLTANAALQLMSLYSDPGVAVGTTWTRVGLAAADFVVSFFCADDPACAAASTDVDWASGTKQVEAFNIQPILSWTSATKIAKNATGTIYLRNFTIKKVSKFADVAGVGCTGTSYVLDAFPAGSKGQSNQGGYWFAFTDTSSTKVNDTATGMSTLTLPTGMKAWKPVPGTGAMLTATLEKNVAASTFPFHKYAGWASMGVGLPVAADSDGVAHGITLASLTSISFDFFTGANVGTGSTFDATLVPAINFKIGKAGVADDVQYSIPVPATQGAGSNICVDLTDVKQPSWYKNGVDLTPEGLTQLVWEMKIDDQKTTTIHTSGPNTMMIQNVTLWGVAAEDVCAASGMSVTDGKCTVGILNRAGFKGGLKASYNNALTLSYKVSGPSASVSVVRLDGTTVASFKTASVAKNLSLPVSLSNGTYMVVVRGDKAGAMVSRIAVSK